MQGTRKPGSTRAAGAIYAPRKPKHKGRERATSNGSALNWRQRGK